jgi:hypothetical protein
MAQFLELVNSASATTIRLDGQSGTFVINNTTGKQLVKLSSGGDLLLGGNGEDGDIFLFPKWVETVTTGLGAGLLMPTSLATVHVDGNTGTLTLKKVPKGTGLAIALINSNDKEIVRIYGRPAPPQDDEFITYESGRIDIKNSSGKDSIILDGQSGDIVLKNADCAEEFDLAPTAGVEPGTVVVLDEEGKLRESRQPYDKKVAGVISGAGDCRPGLVLDRQESRPDRLPVALMGKVYCKADAGYAAIEVGDLLTTSATPGHAMRADDPGRAFGAVFGKALRSLRAGQGLIPILVALQ